MTCHSRRAILALSPAFFIAVSLCLLSSRAFARPEFVEVLLKAYTPAKDSALFKAAKSCTSCHAGGPPKLNPYGKDVKEALRASGSKALTLTTLQSIEAKDSNGDGASNGDSLRAGNNPAEADAKPTGITPTQQGTSGANEKTNTKSAEAPSDSPFNIKSLIAPKHANHPVLVHFPIALFMIGLLFDILAIRQKKPLLIQVGYYNLLVATISTLPTLLSGLGAWQWAYGGVPLTGYLLLHLCLGIVTSLLLFTLWKMRAKKRDDLYQGINGTYFLLATIALILIMVTGHLGGFLIFDS